MYNPDFIQTQYILSHNKIKGARLAERYDIKPYTCNIPNSDISKMVDYRT